MIRKLCNLKRCENRPWNFNTKYSNYVYVKGIKSNYNKPEKVCLDWKELNSLCHKYELEYCQLKLHWRDFLCTNMQWLITVIRWSASLQGIVAFRILYSEQISIPDRVPGSVYEISRMKRWFGNVGAYWRGGVGERNGPCMWKGWESPARFFT
jgi:hypothetical protein